MYICIHVCVYVYIYLMYIHIYTHISIVFFLAVARKPEVHRHSWHLWPCVCQDVPSVLPSILYIYMIYVTRAPSQKLFCGWVQYHTNTTLNMFEKTLLWSCGFQNQNYSVEFQEKNNGYPHESVDKSFFIIGSGLFNCRIGQSHITNSEQCVRSK